MLTILGDRGSGHYCDGVSRRTFLRIGGLAMGGLAMPQLLSAEAAAGGRRSHKAIIMIYLPGGPPHLDMFDLKPEAPAEIRGEFSPIKTNVRGIEICELFPRVARMMDKFVAIRTVVGSVGDHSGFQCLTGRAGAGQPDQMRDLPAGGWPYLGSVMSKLQGPADPSMPTSLALDPPMKNSPYNLGTDPGFLGHAHAPFKPWDNRVKDDMVLKGISLDRLQDRMSLLASFDRFRREVDASGVTEAMDASHAKAFGVLTSSKLAQAFDLENEDPKLRDRYGRGSANPVKDAAPRLLDQFLLARRLVEGGARVVTLAFSFWDWHTRNFSYARSEMPMLDQGVSALVQDLHDRGLDKDVSVVVWGEFGRSPRVNHYAGREHWTTVSCALLAGGGMRTGQVIGTTSKYAEEPKDRPVHFQEVFATLYHNMGIDVNEVTVPDLSGRPQYLVDGQYQPIAELI